MWTEPLLLLLQWAFPAGISVVSVFLWRDLRRQKKSQITADTVETWRKIAESNNDALLRHNQIIVENNDTILALRLSLAQMDSNMLRLEQMLQLITACRYYDGCPVRPELQDYRRNARRQAARQPVRNRTANGPGYTGADGTDIDVDPVGGSQAAASRGAVRGQAGETANGSEV